MLSKEAKLEDLLKSLFPLPGELHRFIGRLDDGREIVEALPGPNTPLADVAHQTVIALQARGKIDVALFLVLAESRPGCRWKVGIVAQDWRPAVKSYEDCEAIWSRLRSRHIDLSKVDGVEIVSLGDVEARRARRLQAEFQVGPALNEAMEELQRQYGGDISEAAISSAFRVCGGNFDFVLACRWPEGPFWRAFFGQEARDVEKVGGPRRIGVPVGSFLTAFVTKAVPTLELLGLVKVECIWTNIWRFSLTGDGKIYLEWARARYVG